MAEHSQNKDFKTLFQTRDQHTEDFQLLMLICKRDLKMARISLESMARHASVIPQLILAHDESLSQADVLSMFEDWPGTLELWDRKSVMEYYRSQGSAGEAIATFCDRHIFGFKLAACLRAAFKARTLYSDADVLWFGDIALLMRQYTEHALYGSQELGKKSCDLETLKLAPIHIIQKIEAGHRCCAGFMILNQALANHMLLQDMVTKVNKLDTIHQFSEQTIVNILVAEIGDQISGCDVMMQHPAEQFFRQKPPKIAIHYPGQRKYQLWIDYCA